jgi:hypothetical protein
MAWNESACVPQPSGAAGDNRLDSNANEHGFDHPTINDREWTEERVAVLIELRARGLSRRVITDTINAQTGSTFTKNAIFGKIDRLFTAARPLKTEEEKAALLLARRERDKLKKREARLKVKAPADMNRRRAAIGRVDPGLAVVAFRPEDFTDANVHGLENLEPHHCRFICNDDMSAPVYCGLPMLANSTFSFCAGHHAICCTKPMGRKEPGRHVA